jgi:hypothetical protein
MEEAKEKFEELVKGLKGNQLSQFKAFVGEYLGIKEHATHHSEEEHKKSPEEASKDAILSLIIQGSAI